MYAIKTKHYTRISKAAARKAYAAGESVYMCPVFMNPDSPIFVPFRPVNDGTKFDFWVNACTYYNCNSETGKYLAFYTKTEE
jgi:hypothetical protein